VALWAANMGKAFARRLSAPGHEVLIAARNKVHAEAVVKEIVGPVSAVDIAGVGLADVIIAATPYREQVGALRAAGDLAGKTVIEIGNPVTPGFQDPSSISHTTSAAEEIAEAILNANVVKAFNTVFAQVLTEDPKFGAGKRAAAFYAGDDAAAENTVKRPIESMGFEAIDAGGLRNSRGWPEIRHGWSPLGRRPCLGDRIEESPWMAPSPEPHRSPHRDVLSS
jgi:8-hydroxy-5-deazaflavin:NADPH oxidoreductase